MGNKGSALAIAETGKITDSYASNSSDEGGLSRLELGRHAADSDAASRQLAGSFNAQIRDDFTVALVNAFDIGDQKQFFGFERNGNGGSGVVTIDIQRAAFRAPRVVSNRRDHRKIPAL